MSDDLTGSLLGDDYPELAVCEVCGRAVEWPNGRPTLARRDQEWASVALWKAGVRQEPSAVSALLVTTRPYVRVSDTTKSARSDALHL